MRGCLSFLLVPAVLIGASCAGAGADLLITGGSAWGALVGAGAPLLALAWGLATWGVWIALRRAARWVAGGRPGSPPEPPDRPSGAVLLVLVPPPASAFLALLAVPVAMEGAGWPALLLAHALVAGMAGLALHLGGRSGLATWLDLATLLE